MATPTDLDGMLRSDDDNLELRLADFLTQFAGQPVTVFARFRGSGGGSSERLEPEIKGTADPAGAGNMLRQLEALIVKHLGPSPFGTLRVQGYPKGDSRKPPLDMQRTLIPPDSGGLSDPSVALLKSLHSSERADRRAMQEDLRESHAQLAQLVGVQAQTIATLGTIRTAASASSDLAGLPTLAAFTILMLLWPSIKGWLGLRPDADVRQVIEAAQRRAAKIAAGDVDPAPARPKVPASARGQLEDKGDQAEGSGEELAAELAEAEDPRELLRLPEDAGERAAVLFDRLLEEAEDLAVGMVIAERLQSRPELLAKLAMAGLGKG